MLKFPGSTLLKVLEHPVESWDVKLYPSLGAFRPKDAAWHLQNPFGLKKFQLSPRSSSGRILPDSSNQCSSGQLTSTKPPKPSPRKARQKNMKKTWAFTACLQDSQHHSNKTFARFDNNFIQLLPNPNYAGLLEKRKYDTEKHQIPLELVVSSSKMLACLRVSTSFSDEWRGKCETSKKKSLQ